MLFEISPLPTIVFENFEMCAYMFLLKFIKVYFIKEI